MVGTEYGVWHSAIGKVRGVFEILVNECGTG
jgi:hypothetical protein